MSRLPTIAFGLLLAFALGACAVEPPDDYYAPPPYGAYGGEGPAYAYDDPCVSDPGFCGYATFDGPVWWAGEWYGGPHRWRDGPGGREFWIRGGWHSGVRVGEGHWRGPGRWHPG